MKLVLALFLLLTPALSLADLQPDTLAATNARSRELLQTLIENSQSLTLEGDFNEGDTLAGLLSDGLASQTLQVPGQTVYIVSVNSSCRKTGETQDATTWACTLSIGSGDYVVTRSGYKGPNTESATHFSFETTKSKEPARSGDTPRHQIKSKTVRVWITG